ncbi:hypothetical protein F5B22DRAFT_635635 [Xylaria bambusicola]|uniref:uncharacterized protein n=1 Tax=Xylaria bambusicola TaxID=326684 RepID=UPI0020079187|nr:uncharacterized protein F5B22DRAFT_635635 [Xylaria bambusicola]KAI0517744.1 hypothetical protein F5B22DRAFT_635635 [Xylaria bambusicola]
MFSAFASLVPQTTPIKPPENVPPPTPLSLPQCNPRLPQSAESSGKRPCASLVRFLQTLHRPTEVNESHFAALGVHVHVDAAAEDVVPDPSFIPSASGWDGIDLDEARRRDPTFRRPLSNGRLSPEARSYAERRDELSVANQTAFRTVRRMKPEPGKPPIRLGNCYEFFRLLEFLATYWDDSSLPNLQDDVAKEDQDSEQTGTPERITYRTVPGSQMPAEIRHNLVSAFVKLVSYDFGCNIAPPRVEPRLHLAEPLSTKAKPKGGLASRRMSYFSSGCVFICRTPITREAARAGIVEGPIAAVSARNTTSFSKPLESNIDFGRELIAALVTAQLRAREGKTEKRFGEGQWWATAKRWGGGEGGPIGREVEGDIVVGDKDTFGGQSNGEGSGSADTASSSTDKPSPQEPGYPRGIPVRGAPLNKKPRKTLSVYDRYRMVRLPSSNWDKKARYEAIGKIRGSGYDDVFVVSSLFHHLSVLRVRVPERLLHILDGTSEDTIEEDTEREGDQGEDDKREGHSWGKLEIWRSHWFDLFIVEQRLEAMRLLWGMMAWSMRQTDHENDEIMANA